LICVVFEMHRDFTEHPAAYINSVIKILSRGENDFGLFKVAGIQIDGTLNIGVGRSENRCKFFFEIIRLPLDFGQAIRFNKPREREKFPIDKITHFGFVVVGEVERNHVGPVIDRTERCAQVVLDFRYEFAVGNENADE